MSGRENAKKPGSRRALLICAPSPLEIGNAPVGTVKLVRAMLDRGWEIDILGFRWGRDGHSDAFFCEMLDGAGVYERRGFLGKPSGWVPGAVRTGTQLLAARSYDLLLSFAHLTWTHVVGLFLKRKSRLPWVAFFTDPWSNHPLVKMSSARRAAERLLEWWTYSQADALVFPHVNMRDFILDPYPRREAIYSKCFAIPYFFDPKLYPPVNPSTGSGKIVIGHIGTIPPGGYVEGLFHALRVLLTENSVLRARLSLEFHGGYRPNPKELVQRLSLEDHVCFHPPVSYKESLKVMRESHLLLFFGIPPHTLGGLGIATLHLKFCDYIGAERPIFALAGKGSPAYEALERTNGICVEQDPVSIRAALAEFLIRPELPEPRVRERFSREHVFPFWEEVFDRVIGRR